MDLHSLAMDLRSETIAHLADATRAAVLEPADEHGSNVASRRERGLTALNQTMEACETLVKTLAAPGHERFAERDLPESEKENLARARHYLKILNTLYGPQVEPAQATLAGQPFEPLSAR